MNCRIKKASKIATIAAALLFSLGLLTSSPAQAAAVSNGLTTNGFSMNGFSMNGFSMNGWAMNGWSMNGLSPRDRLVGPAGIWGAHGIDPHQPLSAAVANVGR